MSSVVSPPVQCKICNQYFKSQKGLFLHVTKTHKDVVTHKCDHCDKVFESITKLNNHYSSCKNKTINEQSELETLRQENRMLKEQLKASSTTNITNNNSTCNSTNNQNVNLALINIQTDSAQMKPNRYWFDGVTISHMTDDIEEENE